MVKKYKVPVKGSEWRELTFEELTAITNDIERNVGDVLNSIKNEGLKIIFFQRFGFHMGSAGHDYDTIRGYFGRVRSDFKRGKPIRKWNPKSNANSNENGPAECRPSTRSLAGKGAQAARQKSKKNNHGSGEENEI